MSKCFGGYGTNRILRMKEKKEGKGRKEKKERKGKQGKERKVCRISAKGIGREPKRKKKKTVSATNLREF